MTAETASVTTDALTADPIQGLAALATEVEAAYRSMGAGDQLTLTSSRGTFVMGKHEVPALALLFRNFGASPEITADALDRAHGYIATATIIRHP